MIIRPAVLCFLLGLASSSSGLIFYSTDDPEFNTSAPEGELAGSGWDLQGNWGSVLATPIAPHYFLAARHTAGQIGDAFLFDGRAYTTIAFFDCPQADLRLWKIGGSFPRFASLYEKEDETGRRVVVFGRGTRRGPEIIVETPIGPQLKGWLWGVADHRKRWGENQVTRIVPVIETNSRSGDLLQCEFNANAGATEVHLSVGDSGGGLFIDDGTGWKLAGINLGVDGPYRIGINGERISAALFDEGALFEWNEEAWQWIDDIDEDQPGSFYATRISSNLSWIREIVDQPDPRPILLSANGVRPFAQHAGFVVDSERRRITLPVPKENRLFILLDDVSRKITGIEQAGATLEISYE